MAAAAALTPAEQAELRSQCTAFLAGHGPVTPAAMLAGIPADTVPDRYGDGGVVAELEAEVAGLLGQPAAVFLPSGTMAQQSVLRVHADRRQRRTVVFHPMCHLDQHEGQAFARLHGLTGRQVPMMHLLLETTQDGFTAAARRLAAEQQIWTWAGAMVTADPGVQRVELSVGDATCALPPEQVRDVIAALAAPVT